MAALSSPETTVHENRGMASLRKQRKDQLRENGTAQQIVELYAQLEERKKELNALKSGGGR